MRSLCVCVAVTGSQKRNRNSGIALGAQLHIVERLLAPSLPLLPLSFLLGGAFCESERHFVRLTEHHSINAARRFLPAATRLRIQKD